MKSMFHMLHYISIIQLVLKSSTLIIYCASCKWSIHMEPSFSTFLMLFPGYKLQENISYLKEGNALNECYTKEDTQSLLEKRVWEMCGARGSWHPLLSGMRQILQPGETTLPPKFPLQPAKCLPMQEPHLQGEPRLGVPLECHQALRSLPEGALEEVAWPPKTPFCRGFAPTKKRIPGSPPSLTAAQPLPGLGRSHLESHNDFFTLCRAFKWPVKNSYRILIAKLCTYTKPALPWFGGKLSARMTF